METVRFTLVGDGSSDRILLPIVEWTLRKAGVLAQGQFADPRQLPRRCSSFSERLAAAVDRFPCQVLFVHRDAEAGSWDQRRDEIRNALIGGVTPLNLPAVAVIPVRMSEAWLCFDFEAIRWASGNPAGQIRLKLPRIGETETERDPKARLHEALREASERTGRRRKAFNPHTAVHLIAERIQDFSPLRALPAFQRFEAAIDSGVKGGWRAALYDGSV
jgi:hypothetical protein